MNLTTLDRLRIIVAGVVGDISEAQWKEIEQGLIHENLRVMETGPISFLTAADEAYKILGMDRKEWDPRGTQFDPAIMRRVVSTDPLDSATLGLVGDALKLARAE